jgi:hypothetical protein
MRRAGWCAVAVALAVALGVTVDACAADDKPFVEEQSGLEFPAKLGSLARQSTRKYDQPGMGVSIRYSAPRLMKADVYVYDLGEDQGTGIDSESVTKHFTVVKEQVSVMQKRGEYQDVKTVYDGTLKLHSPAGPVPMLYATFNYTETPTAEQGKASKRTSHALLTAYNGKFIKIRFTYMADEPHGEDSLKAFLFDFEKVLK